MNSTFLPSLEYASCIKMAVILWNQDDIRTSIETLHLLPIRKLPKDWQEVEAKVTEKVPKLILPETLKNKILDFIKPVGLQILGWMQYHVYDEYLCINLPSSLCWTLRGTVDRKRTAEVLIEDESLDTTKRYKLACIYCLENHIPLLWDKIPENLKTSFYSEKNPDSIEQCQLVNFWTYHLKGELSKLNTGRRRINYTTYKNMFQLAALDGHIAAVEYFLPKLTPQQRDENLFRGASTSVTCGSRSLLIKPYCNEKPYTDILCFLLREMNPGQKMRLFKFCTYQVLFCLLSWPWVDVYLEIAEIMGNLLSKMEYNLFLCHISYKIQTGFKDYNYQNIFRMFWQQSSDTYKKYVIKECVNGTLLRQLFSVNDKENIMLILEHATVTEREKIVLSRPGICFDGIINGKWELLQFFVKMCISSKDLMIKYRELVEKVCMHLFMNGNDTENDSGKEIIKRKKDTCLKFFKLLDDFILADDKKRSIEDDDNYPCKKIRSEEFGGAT